MPLFLGLTATLIILCAAVQMQWGPLTPKGRLRIAAQFLMAVFLFWLSNAVQRRMGTAQTKLDRGSVVASFSSISAEGPQRQLVFHYLVKNTTRNPLRINLNSCSAVSFRFAKQSQDVPVRAPQPNPALHLLEKDNQAYAGVTGLKRLATTNATLSLDQCPLELQPKQTRAVAIAIPYAYPDTSDRNPSADKLKSYVRAAMPRIDGFGLFDAMQRYEIEFPRGW